MPYWSVQCNCEQNVLFCCLWTLAVCSCLQLVKVVVITHKMTFFRAAFRAALKAIQTIQSPTKQWGDPNRTIQVHIKFKILSQFSKITNPDLLLGLCLP